MFDTRHMTDMDGLCVQIPERPGVVTSAARNDYGAAPTE
jgi:hypothetical protein